MISVIKKTNIIVSVVIFSISLNIDICLGQSWRTNDRIETFRTRQRIENQLVCAEKDTTFELVTGIFNCLMIEQNESMFILVTNEWFYLLLFD